MVKNRFDLTNYAQSLSLLGSLFLLWLMLHRGWKLTSLPAASAAAWLINALVAVWACRMCNVFPGRAGWGRPSWRRFKEIFGLGKDLFLVTVGTQLIMASQTIIVTRALGLEASAVWTVCTKSYMLVNLLVWRVYDFACPAFAEMFVRHEQPRLRQSSHSKVGP